MKIILNKCFGGFSIDESLTEFYDRNRTVIRFDQDFIEFVEKNPEKVKYGSTFLKVIEIPNEATDWGICDYDGNETLIYVVDGKLHSA